MGDNRYRADDHATFIACSNDDCGARNAPPTSPDFEDACWRCEAPLDTGEVAAGDELAVDIVDEREDGASIGKTEGGLVVFINEALATPRAVVRVTDVARNHCSGEFVRAITESEDAAEDIDSSGDSGGDVPTALGSRDNFWNGSEEN